MESSSSAFEPASCSCAWDVVDGSTSAWIPAIHEGDRSWFLASVWLSTGCSSPLENRLVDGKYLSLFYLGKFKKVKKTIGLKKITEKMKRKL